MKDLIKKYIGITGFIIALVGILISAYHKFYYNDEFDTIGQLSLLLWLSTLTISNELNKSDPKKWNILNPNKTNKKPHECGAECCKKGKSILTISSSLSA